MACGDAAQSSSRRTGPMGRRSDPVVESMVWHRRRQPLRGPSCVITLTVTDIAIRLGPRTSSILRHNLSPPTHAAWHQLKDIAQQDAVPRYTERRLATNSEQQVISVDLLHMHAKAARSPSRRCHVRATTNDGCTSTEDPGRWRAQRRLPPERRAHRRETALRQAQSPGPRTLAGPGTEQLRRHLRRRHPPRASASGPRYLGAEHDAATHPSTRFVALGRRSRTVYVDAVIAVHRARHSNALIEAMSRQASGLINAPRQRPPPGPSAQP